MYLCYIDESGNTGNNLKDAQQPYLVLTALLVPPESIKAIERDIRDLAYRYFGAESRNTDFEFHGDHIYNGRGRYFSRISLDKRIDLFSALIDIAIRHESIQIGYINVEKAGYYGNLHIQQVAFSLLVEKLEEKLGSLDSHGLLVADEQDELEQKLIDDLDHFKQHGTQFGYKKVNVERIIDSVHFVQSHNNYLIQLTDVICYLIRRKKEANDKLNAAYKDYSQATTMPMPFYPDWLDEFGHKGLRYFYKTCSHLNSNKAWLFAKDFPR